MGFEPTNIGFANRSPKNISPDNKETYGNSKTRLTAQLTADGAPKAENTPEIDPDLKAIISAWDSLPAHIKQTIKTVAGITEK